MPPRQILKKLKEQDMRLCEILDILKRTVPRELKRC